MNLRAGLVCAAALVLMAGPCLAEEGAQSLTPAHEISGEQGEQGGQTAQTAQTAAAVAPEEIVAMSEFKEADAFYKGDGIPKNYAMAEQKFRKLADEGWSEPQRALGMMYMNGQGVEQNNVQAYKWLSLAASEMRSRVFASVWLPEEEKQYRDNLRALLTKMEANMTQRELALAQKRAMEWTSVNLAREEDGGEKKADKARR